MNSRNPYFLLGMIEEAARQIGKGYDHRPLARQIEALAVELAQSLVDRRVSASEVDRCAEIARSSSQG